MTSIIAEPSIPNVGSPTNFRRRASPSPPQVSTIVVVKCPNCNNKFRTGNTQEYCSKECAVTAQWFKKSSQTSTLSPPNPQDMENFPSFWRVRSRAPSPTPGSPGVISSPTQLVDMPCSPLVSIKSEVGIDHAELMREFDAEEAVVPEARPEVVAPLPPSKAPVPQVVVAVVDDKSTIQARPPAGPRPSRRLCSSSPQESKGRNIVQSTASVDSNLQNMEVWRDCHSVDGDTPRKPRKPIRSFRATQRIETTYKSMADLTHRGSLDFKDTGVVVSDDTVNAKTTTRATLNAIVTAASDYLNYFSSTSLKRSGRFVKN
jgi:hypothetical protein